MNTITIIGLILIFIGGIGAILLAVGQFQSSESDKSEIINITKNENTDLKNQITELKNESNILNDTLEERDKRIRQQNQEIKSLSIKLVEKAEYIEEFVAGKNRFPFVEMKKVLNDKGKADVFVFSIENSFKYPIYNIQIQAFDYDKIVSATYKIETEKKQVIKMTDYLDARIFEYKTEEIPSGEFRMSPKQYPARQGNIYIKIHSRSKSVIQKIVFVKHGNMTYVGYVIIDHFGKVLKEHIYDNTPNEIQLDIKAKLKNIPYDLDLIFTE